MNDPRFLPPSGDSKLRRGASNHRGGFAVGLIIGLLIGLAIALGVALYITKAPVPFLNKVQQRTAGQDAAEAERNKNWDPNSPLYGKNPAKQGGSATGSVAPDLPAVPPTLPPPVATAPVPAPVPVPGPTPHASASQAPGARDPAAILADKPTAARTVSSAASGQPGVSSTGAADPFTYFVQAGAYGRTEDAEQQRARLAMIGMEGKMSEREQSGRTVYRVRVGPFGSKTEADAAKDKLAAAGVETALVRVQR